MVAGLDEREAFSRWPGESDATVAWDELESVAIWTTDTGPFVEDVFLILQGKGQTLAVPQESEGFDGLLKRVAALPGFDHGAVCAAMTCTDNHLFPCWPPVET